MTRTVERRYDRTPRELVEGMVSEEYQRDRGAALGGISPATIERNGDLATVRWPRRLPLEHLPSQLRKLAGNGHVTQVERWTSVTDDRCTAEWESESRLPGKVSGTFEVVHDGDGALYRVTATVKVNVPLIGGRIGKEAEEQVVKLIEQEMDFAEEWLESH
ncbi:MAG TPA: DUF2505 domain-containing protein [Frankiaceae bacterium]|nr:DUF2505 domain-containing protein [Frankiaceae bacterium]